MILISALCGIGFGYAAQRGSICVISGIESLLSGRSPRVFLSFVRCSIWVIAISLPLAWLMPGEQLDMVTWPNWQILLGGALFGAGAAINGGCSFGTMIRLGSGDASFMATLVGIGLGVVAYGWLFIAVIPERNPSPLEVPSAFALTVLGLSLLFCLREIALLFRRKSKTDVWPPERAAMLMGISAGILYAIHGSWAYTVAIERGLATMMRGGIANVDLALIFLACLVGAAFAAEHANRFHLRLNIRDLPKHLLGGTIMGIGAAAIPGGNDALILHGVPAFSPHAALAYLALIAGASAAIAVARWFDVGALAEDGMKDVPR